MVQFAPLYEVEISDMDVDLRVEFDDSSKYDLSGPGVEFQRVVYQLKVKSPSVTENIQKLVNHAENGCHAAQSLRQSVPVILTTEIIPTI
jgi:organic hydroperoxide reductase OsmC/OhrA